MNLLLCCLLAVTAKAAPGQPIILDGATDAYASEFVFFASDYGIYVFNRSSETWSRITTASGLPSNRVLALGLDEGVLWVATDSGLASADIRVNDWETYTLPGTVRAIAFDDRYVWAGGDSGLKRYDKFSEAWQHRGDSPALDLLAEKDRLWIASGTGVLCYDAKFDRIDQMPAPTDSYFRIMGTPNRIWFAGSARFAGYRRDAASWAEYSAIRVENYSVLGDTVLFAVGAKAFMYDPGSDRWDVLIWYGLPARVTDAYVSATEMLFASDEGLVVLNTREDTRQIWTRSNGLESDTILRVYADQRFLYALGENTIQYFDRQQRIWKHENLVPPQARKQKLVYLDDAGAHLRLVPDTDIRLSGRAYYSQSRTLSGDTSSATHFENIGLNLGAKHKTGRTGAIFYDDSDPDQVAYGFGYRGIAPDLLNRANVGKLKTEYADFDLIPQSAILGANARLKRGDHGFDLGAGRLESVLRSDFFSGRSVKKEVKRRDLDYARNVFYRIPGPPPLVSRPYAWDTVFVDDRDPQTNSPRTRVGFTVRGITGDFEPLVRGLDYFLDHHNGIIHFLSPRKPAEVLVLLTDAGAQVLQSDSVAGNTLKHTYSFGPDIAPGSFALQISDTAGHTYPLSGFGIDDDRDGQVDPVWLNCDLGLLSFPSPLVPDTLALSVYTLGAKYESRTTFYSLSHYPVVKNSEAVLVDGVAMTRGADYVMDYTSGILLFLKRDAVTDFSQIDVRYSSKEHPNSWSSEHLVFSGQPTIAVGRHVTLAPGFTRLSKENILHLSGRAEAGAGTDKSLRFVPQFAVEPGRALAQDYALSGNYGLLSAAAQYRGFGQGFKAFGVESRRYGPLRHSGALSLGVEPLPQFRLDGSAGREYLDSLASLLTADYVLGKVSYLNPKHPNGFVLAASDRLPDGNRLRVKVNYGYELSLRKSKLKLNAIIQHTTLDPRPSSPDRSLEYIADASFSLPVPIRGSVRYRNNGLTSDGQKTRREDELRGQLNVDVVPGLFYTGAYNLQTEAGRLGTGQDLALQSYFYNHLQVAPGRWWTGLSIVNFSVGSGSNFDEYCRNLDSNYVPPLLLLRPLDDSALDVSSANDLRTLYGTVQLQPLAGLTLRAKRTVGRSGKAYYGLPELAPSTEDELKAEYEPDVILSAAKNRRLQLGMFTVILNARVVSGLPRTTRRSLYTEWNMPWSELLRTRLTTTYGFDEEYYSAATTLRPRSLTPNLEARFRFSPRSYATAGFGLAWDQRTFRSTASGWTPDPWQLSLRPAAGFNLNLFRFLYAQLNYSSALPLSGTATHSFSARITTQW